MTSPGARVRAARRADAVAVAALVAEFVDYLRALGDRTPFCFDATAFLRDGFGRRAAFRPLVAVRDDELVGYLFWQDGYDSDRAVRLVHVVDLFVTRARRGVGRALMTAVGERALARGAVELQWAVYLANRAARAFYTRLGARPIDDLCHMRLPLRVPGRDVARRSRA